MQKISQSNEEKKYIKDILYKGQFAQKLGLKYLLATDVSLGYLTLVFLFNLDFLHICWSYIMVMAIYAKWFFSYTKNKGYYQIFLIKIYCHIKRLILVRLREMY